MRFGERVEEVGDEPTGGDTRYMRPVKKGETRFRFLQEVKDWERFYEHYNPNPGGFPFPCTRDKATCPGCTSGNERMEKASRKYAVNALVGGYVDIYKMPLTVKNRMEIRSERNGGTILDRDYLVTRTGSGINDTEYDVEGLTPGPVDLAGKSLHDIEGALQTAFKEAWPEWSEDDAPKDSGVTSTPSGATQMPSHSGLGEFDRETTSNPSKEEKVVSESDLRAMDKDDLVKLCAKEKVKVPDELIKYGDTNTIVNWLLENQAE